VAVRLAVLADTHVPTRARDLPPGAWRVVLATDGVLHAGDVVDPALLARLGRGRPLWAVLGNNDRGLADRLPERLEFEVGGVPIAMVHDSGAAAGRRGRLRRWFPSARVVVFGHSHVPVLEDENGLLLLNPGSPTDRRRMPTFTVAVLTIDGPGQVSAELVDLGQERATSTTR
jgi:hypothetical protein